MRQLLGLAAAAALLGGCGSSYLLQGRAVRGSSPTMDFVSADSDELKGRGLRGVKLEVYRDPTSLGSEVVARGRTDAAGNFSIPVSAFGAGWMSEQWRITAVRPGFETAEAILSLPSGKENQRLLIMMNEGTSIAPKRPDDLWGEYERFK